MKRNKTIALLTLLLSSGMVQAQEQQLALTGRLKNGQADQVYLHRFENKIFTVIDSAKVKKGKFSFARKLDLPELYGLSTTKEEIPYYVFLDRENNLVDFDLENKNSGTVVQGSPSHLIYQEYKGLQKPDITAFIKKYPDAIVSSYLLYREWSYRLAPEELEANIALLSAAQQETRYIADLRKIIAVSRQVAVGKKAPAIVAKDPDGKAVALYDQLQTYTLVDFWASWCPPCRKENPNIVANYQKFHDRGFGIYAVSLDKTKDAWVKGIKDDKLTWLHVSELKYWDSEIAKAYAVRAIPANFLVDNKGVIVAKNLRGEELGRVLDSLFNAQSKDVGLKKDFKGQNPIAYVSTESQAIDKQKKGTFALDERVFFSNDFDGARLNAVSKTADGVYHLLIAPEKTPINQSPWYGFQLWAATDTTVQIQLDYAADFQHRYDPKISRDGVVWLKVAGLTKDAKERPTSVRFQLPLSQAKTWISAQENIPSSKVYSWLEQVGRAVDLQKVAVGKTVLDKPLYVYGVGNATSKKRLLVLGRQHPPEITGHYAFASFTEYLLGDTEDAKALREQYYIYFVPVVNPDGVDLGHWRTNASGVDLNRDWAAFNQPESRAIRDYFEREIKAKNNELHFAIDFHSTGSDIYYTVDPTLPTRIANFIPDWIASLKEAIPGYDPLVKPLYFEGPTYTAYSYFYKNYAAESLVYEIGDDTDKDFIVQKARVSAKKLIEKLNEYEGIQ